MTSEAKPNLLTTPVNRMLLLMASPINLGMLSTFLFQVVDNYFVGKLGATQLAALGFASTIYVLLVNMVMGLAVGVGSLVGRSLGKGDSRAAAGFATPALLFTLVISIVVSIAGYFTIHPLFGTLGADSKTLAMIEQYMSVLYLGLPVLNLGIVGGAAVRASGRIAPPEIIMGIAGVINLVLDYLLIFGAGPIPAMGIAGAAWATVTSWVFIGLAIPVYLLKGDLIRVRGLFADGERIMNNTGEILRLSGPAILTQILTPLTATFLIFLIAKSGADAVAAFGIATRIEMLALVGIFAVSTAVTPFIAQNLGARLRERIEDAVVFAGKASIYWGLLIMAILLIFAGPIARIFSDDAQVLSNTKLYFYITALSYPAFGLMTVTSAIFNGIQIPRDSLKILLVKTFVLTIPLTLLGSLWGYLGILVGLSLSNIAGGIHAARVMKRSLVKSGSALAKRSPMEDYRADLEGVIGRFRGRRNQDEFNKARP